MIEEIRSGDILLAKVIRGDAWKPGLSFFSADGDFIQAGTWNYDGGKELLPHIHNEFERTSMVTQEVIFVRAGSLLGRIYDPEAKLVQEITLKAGDTLIALRGGHGYRILEPNTQVLEVKNGPYSGPDKDRRRI